MNIFLPIIDRNTQQELNLNMTLLRTYKSKDIIEDDTTHYIIFYLLTNNVYFEEEFNNASDRDAKLEELNSYSM